MRKSGVFITWVGAAVMLWAALYAYTLAAHDDGLRRLALMERQVSAYGLTDLCLFTEARYTRNLAVADFWTAFQDHPASLEHFPSGSLVEPPPHLLMRGSRDARRD